MYIFFYKLFFLRIKLGSVLIRFTTKFFIRRLNISKLKSCLHRYLIFIIWIIWNDQWCFKTISMKYKDNPVLKNDVFEVWYNQIMSNFPKSRNAYLVSYNVVYAIILHIIATNLRSWRSNTRNVCTINRWWKSIQFSLGSKMKNTM